MGVVDEPGNGYGLLRYKVDRNSDRLAELEKWKAEVDKYNAAQAERDKTMHTDVQELKDSFDSLRVALRNFALTIAGGAVLTALSVLFAAGRL